MHGSTSTATSASPSAAGCWVTTRRWVKLVTSANVACGFHAGDPTTLRRTCELAAAAGVVVGAQVGYCDLVGFGRRFVDMDPGALADDVTYQLGALAGMAQAAGTGVRYVKPRGALYNATVHHEAQAQARCPRGRGRTRGQPVAGGLRGLRARLRLSRPGRCPAAGAATRRPPHRGADRRRGPCWRVQRRLSGAPSS